MARKFRRRFNIRLIKLKRTYSITEVAELFGVHSNTVWSWMKEGLKRIDDVYPYLVHGEDLAEFLAARQVKKMKLEIHQFNCFKCKVPRQTWEGQVDLIYLSPKIANLKGVCESCGSGLNKRISVAKSLPEIRKIFQVQQVHNEELISSVSTSTIYESKRKV